MKHALLSIRLPALYSGIESGYTGSMPSDNYTPLNDSSQPSSDYALPKEAEPSIARVSEVQQNDEVQEVVEAEPHASVQEVVETKKGTIKLPEELKGFGIVPVDATNFPDYQNIKLPISDDQVIIGSKAPPSSPLRWLSTFAQYLLWKAGLKVRVIHGKVVRVVTKRA